MTHRLVRSALAAALGLAACTVQQAPPAAPEAPPEESMGEPMDDPMDGQGDEPVEGDQADVDDAVADAEAGVVDVGGDLEASGAAELEAGDEPAPAAGPASGGRYRPHVPIRCVGSKDLRLVGRSIDTSGDAIEVLGSCDVVLDRCRIRAGGSAIAIKGSGTVTVSDSYVEGRRAAVRILGSGDLRARRTRFVGRRSVMGSGQLHDDGGNTWR